MITACFLQPQSVFFKAAVVQLVVDRSAKQLEPEPCSSCCALRPAVLTGWDNPEQKLQIVFQWL